MCRSNRSVCLPNRSVSLRNRLVPVATLVLGLSSLLAWSPSAYAHGSPSCRCAIRCTPIVKQVEDVYVPLEGPPMNGCIPPGTYVKGYLHVKTKLVQTLCKTLVVLETHTHCAKIFVPGVGEFWSKEITYDETEVNLIRGETEIESSGKFRYRLDACDPETYSMAYRMRVRVDLTGRRPVAHCEQVYLDCYDTCCGGGGGDD